MLTLRFPIVIATAVLLLLTLPAFLAFAQDDDTGVDMQAEYERKTVMYFNTWFDAAATADLTSAQRTEIASTIRDAVELNRFDIFRNFPSNPSWTLQEFAREFRAFLAEHADEIAEARASETGEAYDWEYRDIVLTLDMIERVRKSGYIYTAVVPEFTFEYVTEPRFDEANGWEWTAHWYRGSFRAEVRFFKLAMEGEPVLTPLENGVIHLSGTHRTEPLPIKDLVEAEPDLNPFPGEVWEELEEGEREQMLADARQEIYEICTDGMSRRIDTGVRNIPEFKIRANIDERIGDEITIPFGRAEDIYTDEGFHVYEMDENGNKRYVGYSRVRHVGTGQVGSERGQSLAELDRTRMQLLTEGRTIQVGDLVEEHAWIGFEFGLFGGLGIFQSSAVGQVAANNVLFGGSVEIHWDTARVLNWPEFWFGFNGYFFGGDGGVQHTWGIEVVFTKKFYNVFATGIAIAPTIGAGFARYNFATANGSDINTFTTPRGGTNIAAGLTEAFKDQFYAKVQVQITYFLHYMFEIYLKLEARVLFDNSDIVENGGIDAYLPGLNPALVVPFFQLGIRIFF